MATADTLGVLRPPAPDAFAKAAFSTEVLQWLRRASPSERDQFSKVFEEIKALSDNQQADNDTNASPERTTRAATHAPGNRLASRVPRGAGSSSTYVYTATMAALNRPGRPMSSQGYYAADTAAEDTTSSSGADAATSSQGGRDKELLTFRRASTAAAARRRTASQQGASAIGALDTTPPVRHNQQGEEQQQQKQQQHHGARSNVLISPDATTYQESYNLREYYPALYEKARNDTKADPVPNYTLISEWGDSLRAGADKAARMHMRTTYAATNDEVHKTRTDFDSVKEAQFYKWMAKQKTYYLDLLKAGKVKELDALLAKASQEEKRELLDVLRQVHCVADPDAFRSHTHSVHGPMSRTEDDEVVALLRDFTKTRTMGASTASANTTSTSATSTSGMGCSNGNGNGQVVRPRTAAAGGAGGASTARPATAELRPAMLDISFGGNSGNGGGGRRPASAGGRMVGASSQPLQPTTLGGGPAAAAAHARPMTAGPAGRTATTRPQGHGHQQQRTAEKKDTFMSKVPLKWATGTSGPQLSSYLESFGGGKYMAGRERPSSALFKNQAIKYKEVTAPIGAVNSNTAMAPFRSAYPVPAGYTTTLPFPQPVGDVTMETTYRTGFAPRDEKDVVRSLKASAELTDAAHKALLRSTLPLGRTGINLVPGNAWQSEYVESYHDHPIDVQGNYEQAVSVKRMFTGPTGSVGKVMTVI